MRPIGTFAPVACWHCGQPIDFSSGEQTARYLYRGDQPFTVVIEDWMHCACGAYQNVRRLNEIRVDPLGNT
jgi:sarcosine oxidase delta subunit